MSEVSRSPTTCAPPVHCVPFCLLLLSLLVFNRWCGYALFQRVLGSSVFFFLFFRTTPFLLIPRGHMPRTLKRTSASPPHRRFKIFAPGVPGPHTEDINRISRTRHFAGASPSPTLKLNSYSRKLFHMAPITRLGKTSQLDVS